MESWQITTGPTVEPVTLAEAKLHLRVGVPGGTATSITQAAVGVVTKRSHGLATGDVITWTAATGMVELNGDVTTVTYVSNDTFSIGDNTTAYAASNGTESYSVNHEDDDMITGLIEAARTQFEVDTYRSIITQTITFYLPEFPAVDEIILPRPKLITITSLSYQDVDDATQTLTEGVDFEKDITREPGRIYLKKNISWPSTYGEPNDVVIVLTAGYGAAATNVPEGVKQAIKLLIGDYYDLRGMQIEVTPLHTNKSYKAIANQYLVPRYE